MVISWEFPGYVDLPLLIGSETGVQCHAGWELRIGSPWLV